MAPTSPPSETNDVAKVPRKSWLDIDPSSDFSLQNIPFGICSIPPLHPHPRCCTAIGSHCVDLSVLADAGLFSSITVDSSSSSFPFPASHVFSQPTLNEFMSYSRPIWVAVRNKIIDLFADDDTDDSLRTNEILRNAALHPLQYVTSHLPATIGDYTDFYSSREHATNVGTMFRGKDNALQPNWLHLPVGYHGRSSTVYISGTPVRRPRGQLQLDPDNPNLGSTLGPSKLLDFELEVAFFVGGTPNAPGATLTMSESGNRIFGFVLMNDWSARDIQKWEYVPLGPFTAKNFATTISPWVVTTMALEEYTGVTSAGPQQTNPQPLEYLYDDNYNSYDIHLTVHLQGETMTRAQLVSQSNFRNLYWNAKQQLVHHTVTGCVMKPGDLLASGTISGSDPSSFGSMLELSWKGSREVKLGDTGEVRKFLQDGDTVILQGWCYKEDVGRIGFGDCCGKVLPALLPGSKTSGAEEEKVEDEKPSSSSSNTIESSSKQAQEQDRYTQFELYGYWRSSASWRVRIAFAAKSLPYKYHPIHLFKGEQCSQEHEGRNPMSQIPVVECMDGITNRTIRVTQSLAIIEFLEEAFPNRGGTLFPPRSHVADRAAVREMSEIVNAGIQPLQNLSVTNKIDAEFGGSSGDTKFGRIMAADAIIKGLKALEQLVQRRREDIERGDGGSKTSVRAGPFALGGFGPTMADVCIVPQLYNARRFGVNVDEICPILLSVEEACSSHPWFVASHADAQVDAVVAPSSASDEPPNKKTKPE